MIKEPVTRTLRIDYEYDEALREEADNQGTSVNNLANHIFKRYTEFDRFFDRGQSIILSPRTFESLINNVDDKIIAVIGRRLGSEVPRDRLLMRGKLIDRESVLWFIENALSLYSDWFTCDRHETKDFTVFYLRHVYNIKWSHFLENYLATMFEELLQIEDVNFITTDLTISFKLKK
jgi:hypothetical protein